MFNDPGKTNPKRDSLVRPESPHSRSFLSKKIQDEAKEVAGGQEMDVVEALYQEIEGSDHEGLKALAKRLKGYIDGNYQEPITIELDGEFDTVKVTY